MTDTTRTTQKRAIGVYRVSERGDREGDSFASPDVQQQGMRKWSRDRRIKLLDLLDEVDVSGGLPLAKRRGMRVAVEAVEQGRADIVLVHQFDRLVRNLEVQREIIDRVEAAGGEVHAGDFGQVSHKTAIKRLTSGMIGLVHEYYREIIREKTAEARERAIRRGIHSAPFVAPGYTQERDQNGKCLEPLQRDPRIAPVIHRVFERRAANAGLREMRAILQEHGVTTSRGGTDWPNAAIYRLLRNRVYLGEARSGEYVNPGAHEPIVDPILFAAANRSRAADPPPLTGDGHLLAGLCRCAGCGYAASPTTATRRNKPRAVIYSCEPVKMMGTCTEPSSVTAATVEKYVVEQFFDLVDTILLEATANGDAIDTTPLEDELARATRASELYRDDPDLEETIRDMGGRDSWRAGLRKRRERVEQATTALVDARGTAQASPLTGLRSSAELRAEWPDLTVTERRDLLSLAFDCVTVRHGRRPIEEKVAIYVHGSVPRELPRRGRAGLPLARLWPDASRSDVPG